MSLEQQIFLLLNLARRESAYGAEITPRSAWYQFNGPGLMQFSQEAYSDIEEINGTQYEKSSTVVKKTTKGTISFRISPEFPDLPRVVSIFSRRHDGESFDSRNDELYPYDHRPGRRDKSALVDRGHSGTGPVRFKLHCRLRWLGS